MEVIESPARRDLISRERPLAPRDSRRAAQALGIGALAGTAVGYLALYRLSAGAVGPSPARALRILRRWSRRSWGRLGLTVRVDGEAETRPCAYVANHRSYLDIPVLAGTLPATFMSRADVASWWIVGNAARATGVVFVDRDDVPSRTRAARTLARRLRTTSVVIFAEGTTGGEWLPCAFHAGLFRLLRRLAVPVVPVTVRYSDRRAYWTDDIGMGAHLWRRVLVGLPLTASVSIGRALAPGAHPDADSLARTAYGAVCMPIERAGELV